MNNNLKITFGMREKHQYGSHRKKIIAKRITAQAQKMYPDCPDLLRGQTNFGEEIATVTINTRKGTLSVEPTHLTELVLKKLSKSFHKKL